MKEYTREQVFYICLGIIKINIMAILVLWVGSQI